MKFANFFSSSRKAGFTLIELLVVIAIVAVLAIVVIATLNPVELFKQARDSNRLSDLATLNQALNIFSTDVGTSLGAASTTYVSTPDPSATSTAGDQCQGLTLPALPAGAAYQCASPANYRNVDGTGWIPVNFKSLSSGVPFGTLPADPINQTSTGLYYTYTTNGTQWEVTALMESAKQKTQFAQNSSIQNFPGVAAQGSNLKLSALWSASGLVGYWPLDEGSGSSTADLSGNGNTGTWVGTAGSANNTYYTAGKVGSYAGTFDGSTDAVTLLNQTLDMATSDFSMSAWIKTPSNAGYIAVYSKGCCSLVGYSLGINTSHQIDLGIDSVSNFHVNGSTNVTDNAWHFVAISVARAGLATFYLDGVSNGTASVVSQSSTISNSTTGTIGSFRGTSSFFNGSIDDVRIYNRAISAAEVQAIYSAQK